MCVCCQPGVRLIYMSFEICSLPRAQPVLMPALNSQRNTHQKKHYTVTGTRRMMTRPWYSMVRSHSCLCLSLVSNRRWVIETLSKTIGNLWWKAQYFERKLRDIMQCGRQWFIAQIMLDLQSLTVMQFARMVGVSFRCASLIKKRLYLYSNLGHILSRKGENKTWHLKKKTQLMMKRSKLNSLI